MNGPGRLSDKKLYSVFCRIGNFSMCSGTPTKSEAFC